VYCPVIQKCMLSSCWGVLIDEAETPLFRLQKNEPAQNVE
jgi:hypothetical protein